MLDGDLSLSFIEAVLRKWLKMMPHHRLALAHEQNFFSNIKGKQT